jgi:hypothetical protein
LHLCDVGHVSDRHHLLLSEDEQAVFFFVVGQLDDSSGIGMSSVRPELSVQRGEEART